MTLSGRLTAHTWRALFFLIIGCYGLLYAPYGINETDGGFLTGLAWQLRQGKVLYQDLLYVRPPLPVWLRALELQILPAQWAILGERWIFYLKLGLYCWLAAATLTEGPRRWQLATCSFIVSAHCYPAAAWHTVDGILFAVLASWLLFRLPGRWGAVLAGLALCAALLCKQSFYPLAVLGLAAAWFSARGRWAALEILTGLLAGIMLFFNYLYQHDLTAGFFRMTGTATTGGQGWQHGVADYFRLQPVLAVLSAVLLLPVARWWWRGQNVKWAYAGWISWLALLIGSYVFAVWRNQDFTPPFVQARLLLWLAVGWWIVRIWETREAPAADRAALPAFGLLLAISWCSAISWGYNLPILLALPGVWAALEIGRRLAPAGREDGLRKMAWANALALVALLGAFRYGYEFVYRDGRRSTMTEDMGTIFPALGGIRSTAETAALYRELRDLAGRYGPDIKTLPAFPQANFLTGTPPPLPLDWVVAREMNGDSLLITNALKGMKPALLLEKRYLPAITTDPELRWVHAVLQSSIRLEETPHFLVLRAANF